MTNIAAVHGPRLRVDSLVAAYASGWQKQQRPSVFAPVLAGVGVIDNSTGMSAREHRHR
jgi:hypothetical protein